MKEPALLLTVQRDVGIVEVEHDLAWRTRVRLEEKIDQQGIHPRPVSRPRIRGLSWTTDKAIAEGFAKGYRQIRVPQPVLMYGEVPKAAIYGVITDRKESELIIDPRHLRLVETVDFGA